MEQLRLISMTICLTLLIWFVADQLQRTESDITVTLRIPNTAGPERVVHCTAGERIPVSVRLSGSNKGMQNLANASPLDIRLDLSGVPEGAGSLDLKQELTRLGHPHLAPFTIISCDPPSVGIIVDVNTTELFPVVLDSGGLVFDVEPTATPMTVEVTLTRNSLASLGADERRITIKLEDFFRDKPPGYLVKEEVPLPSTIRGVSVSTNPDKITVRATLKEQKLTERLQTVPIGFLFTTLEMQDAYRVEMRDANTLLTQTIVVRGPVDVVAALRDRAIKVQGEIVMTSADEAQAGQFVARRPVFNLPAGVELVDEVREIEFRLVKRNGKQ